MGIFSKKKKLQAGLFLDSGSYRYLAIEKSSSGYSVVDSAAGNAADESSAYGDTSVTSKRSVNAVFKDLASSAADITVPIAVSLPTTDYLIRIVNMPGMTLQEAKLAFRYEFENYFPFPLEEGIFDLAEIDYPMPSKVSEKRFIAAAARLSLIDTVMSAASDNGIMLSAIEPAQIALERCATPSVSPCDAAVHLYVGRKRSVLTLSWKGNGIFYRSMSIGFDESLALHPDELTDQSVAFVKEMRSSLQFALSQIRGFEPESIFLHGPGVTDELLELLRDSVSVGSISQINCFTLQGIDFNDATGNWDVALGLAMR